MPLSRSAVSRMFESRVQSHKTVPFEGTYIYMSEDIAQCIEQCMTPLFITAGGVMVHGIDPGNLPTSIQLIYTGITTFCSIPASTYSIKLAIDILKPHVCKYDGA